MKQNETTEIGLPADKEEFAVFVWLFHRISGVLLVVLLPIQIITGVLQTTSTPAARVIRDIHALALLNIVLAFLVVFHGLYGVRAMLLDLGIKGERLLFWICTVVGSLVFLAFLVLYLVVSAP
jgi:succinate dehydrogenase/fumarate reductase cytochrome b subunit